MIYQYHKEALPDDESIQSTHHSTLNICNRESPLPALHLRGSNRLLIFPRHDLPQFLMSRSFVFARGISSQFFFKINDA